MADNDTVYGGGYGQPSDPNTCDGMTVFSFLQTLYEITGKFPLSAVTNEGINDIILGAAVSERTDTAKLIEDICTVYRIDKDESLTGVKFYRNQQAAEALQIAATIRVSELAVLGDGSGTAIKTQRVSKSSLPAAMTVEFIDFDNEFKPNKVTFRRPDSTSDNTTEANIKLPFIMRLETAYKLAHDAVLDSRTASETHTFRLPPKYNYLKSRDIIRIVHDTFIDTIRITQDDFGGDFTVSCTGETVALALTAPSLPVTLPPRPQASTGKGPKTVGYVFDTPVMAIADDPKNGGFVQYNVVAPAVAAGWMGGYLSRVTDGGAPGTLYHSYGPLVAMVIKTSNALAKKRWVTDYTPLQGQLSTTWPAAKNYTRAQLQADATLNLAFYGAPGRWEIVQFERIENGAVVGIVRGLRGTEMHTGTHQPNDLFIVPSSGLAIERRDPALIGKVETYRAVSDDDVYASVASNPPQTIAGNSLKPFAPYRLRAVRDPGTGDVSLSWSRRDRLGSGWGKPLPASDGALGYRVTIQGGASPRTLQADGEGVAYTAAQQSADGTAANTVLTLSVAQIGPLGPGFSIEETVNVR